VAEIAAVDEIYFAAEAQQAVVENVQAAQQIAAVEQTVAEE